MSDYVYVESECPNCGGTVGRAVGSATSGECPECYEKRKRCSRCGGRGRVPTRDDRPFPGGVTNMKWCPSCQSGRIDRDPAPTEED